MMPLEKLTTKQQSELDARIEAMNEVEFMNYVIEQLGEISHRTSEATRLTEEATEIKQRLSNHCRMRKIAATVR